MTKRGFYWAILLASALVLCMSLSIGSTARTVSAETTDNGLRGRYFAQKDLTDPKLTRFDETIDFEWGTDRPVPAIDSSEYSTRWVGQVKSNRSGSYTFTVRSAGGMRLFVNGKRVIDNWDSTGTTERRAQVNLDGDKMYPIRLEYSKNGLSGATKLMWEGPGFDRRVIPSTNLFRPVPKDPPPVEEPPGDVDLPPGAELWSDPDTWGGSVPREGQAVTVPADKTIVLDKDTPSLKSLQVNGDLIFAERDLDLTAGWIIVQGKLQVGTEAEPFTHKANITLTASDQNESVMGMGTKILGVMGGTLELHGKDRKGWTKLSRTASIGANKITVGDASTWKAGDKIVIASTDYDYRQAEEATITAVSGNTVTIDRKLQYQHWGTLQRIADTNIDERAEVGLLSRNITVRGNEASEGNGFGGQIMVMDGEARIEGAELTRMGQKGQLRRYPLHFHMLGNAPESYIKNSSIHNAYNRCVTVHGTNEVNLTGNVCHDTIGHGFFLEDGAEHDNVFENNLAMTIRAPKPGEEVAMHDRKLGGPSGFWITNPDNTFRGNVAAGAEGYGFWFAMPHNPLGLSKTNSVTPLNTPMGEFSGNTAHSNGIEGLRVHDSPTDDGNLQFGYYSPRVDASPNSEFKTAVYENFSAYKNRYHGVWLSGEHQVLTGAKLSDNLRGAVFASQEVVMKDSVVVGETANKGNPAAGAPKGVDGRSLPQPWAPETPVVGYEFYDGNVGADGVKFANFNSNALRKSAALSYTHGTAFMVEPRNFANNISFVNSQKVYLSDPVENKDGDASKVFLDKDGSVTGTAGNYVVADTPFLTNSRCEMNSVWNAHSCDNDYVSLAIETLSGNSSAVDPLKITRQDGVSESYIGAYSGTTHIDSTVISGGEYQVAFNNGLPNSTRYIMRPSQVGSAILKVKAPSSAKVMHYGTVLKSKSGLDELRNNDSTGYYYDDSSGTVYLKIVSNGYWQTTSIQTS